MDIFHTVLVAHSLHWYIVKNYFKPWQLVELPWSFKVRCRDSLIYYRCTDVKLIRFFTATDCGKRELHDPNTYPSWLWTRSLLIGFSRFCRWYVSVCLWPLAHGCQLLFLDCTTCGYGNASDQIIPTLHINWYHPSDIQPPHPTLVLVKSMVCHIG